MTDAVVRTTLSDVASAQAEIMKVCKGLLIDFGLRFNFSFFLLVYYGASNTPDKNKSIHIQVKDQTLI